MKAKLILLLTAVLAVTSAQGAAWSSAKNRALTNANEWLNYLKKSGETDQLLTFMVDELRRGGHNEQRNNELINDINEHVEDMKRLERNFK